MDIKSALEYALFRTSLGCVQRLSPSGADLFFRRLARAAGSLLRMRRQVVKDQLRMVFPELAATELDDLADRVYDHLGRTAAEVFCGDTETLLAGVSVDPGFAELDRAAAAGHGVILAAGHIGNFELTGAVFGRRYRLLDVVKPQRNRAFNRYMENLRHDHGIATVTVDQAGPAVLRHLHDGGMVSLLLDQDAGAQGWPVRFLGHTASTWPGVARFSLRVGCPVFPVAMVRTGPERHTLRIGEPLPPVGDQQSARDVMEHLARISAAVEAFIREAPEQWFWVHRRWKGAQEAKGCQ